MGSSHSASSRTAGDSGLAIFPHNVAWGRVGKGTPFTFVMISGVAAALYSDSVSESFPSGEATLLRVRTNRSVSGAGWLLPRADGRDVVWLPIPDSLSPDGNSRVWSVGGFRIRLRRTGRLGADLFAEANGISTKRAEGPKIDLAADSAMGIDSDSLLNLKDTWRVPEFLVGFRFGTNGPTVVLFSEAGYECQNVRILVFRPTRAEWIEEPHYYGDCTR